MATYEAIPSTLNIRIVKGDDMYVLLTFNQALTGYTFVGKVITSPETDVTVTEVDLANGKIALELDEAATEAITADTYDWYLTWTVGGLTRTVLSGSFQVDARS
jgi:hypothetical protein